MKPNSRRTAALTLPAVLVLGLVEAVAAGEIHPPVGWAPDALQADQEAQTPPAREPREILREIRKAGSGAPAKLFQELAALRTEEALETMIDALGALPSNYRGATAAYYALQAFAGIPRLEEEAIAYLYERSGRTTGYPSAAVGALGLFGEPAHPQLLDLLRKHSSLGIRALALRPLLDALASDGSEEALELLVQNWTGRTVCKEERLAVLLGSFPAEMALPYFREEVKRDALSRGMQRSMVAAVATIPGDEAVGFLRGCLERRRADWLQLAGLRALRARGCVTHGRDVARLIHASEPVLRFTALLEEARLHNGEPEWEREVLKRAKSRSAFDRQSAAAVLSYFPRSRSFAPLLKLLDDRDHTVRSQALATLEAMRWYPTLEPLIERLGRVDPLMREKIHRALVSLTGLPMPGSAKMWRAWWQGEGALYRLPTAKEAAEALAQFDIDKKEAGSGLTIASFFGVPVVSSRVLFIIDVSGSMAAVHSVGGRYKNTTGTRLSVAKGQLLAAIDGLPNGDRFNVMFFESAFELWSDEMTKLGKASRKSVGAFVEDQEARGGTALYDALERVFLDFDLDVDTIYILSDGQPSGGTEDNPARIRETVQEWNQLRHITIHSISIGGTLQLLKQLAEDSGGKFRAVR